MGRLRTAWNALRTPTEEVEEALSIREAFWALAARQDQLEREFTSLNDTINRWAARDRARRQREIARSLPSGDAAAASAEGDGAAGEGDETQPNGNGTGKAALRSRYFRSIHNFGR